MWKVPHNLSDLLTLVLDQVDLFSPGPTDTTTTPSTSTTPTTTTTVIMVAP